MDRTSLTDGELAQQASSGDREAFGELYRRFGPQLYNFCASLLRQPEDAADVLQDTFLRASQKISQLREPARVRAWLYAIARRECYLRTTKRSRTVPVDPMDLNDAVASGGRTAPGLAESRELTDLVRAATAGLADDDRAVLELRMTHDLAGRDLADALGVPVDQIHKIEARAMDRFERSVIALVLVRGARKECPELASIVSVESDFSPVIRKRIARHVESCDQCERRKKFLVNPGSMVASAAPFTPPADMLDRVLGAVDTTALSVTTSPYDWTRSGFPVARRMRKWPIVGAIALAGVFGGAIAADTLSDSQKPTTSTRSVVVTQLEPTKATTPTVQVTTVVLTSLAATSTTAPTTTTTIAASSTTGPLATIAAAEVFVTEALPLPTTTILPTTLPPSTAKRITTTRRAATRRPRPRTTQSTILQPSQPAPAEPTIPPTPQPTVATIAPTEPPTVPPTPAATTTIAATTIAATSTSTSTSTTATPSTTTSTTTTTTTLKSQQTAAPTRPTTTLGRIIPCTPLTCIILNTIRPPVIVFVTTTTSPPINIK